MKLLPLLFLLLIPLFSLSCKDMMDDAFFNKDLEAGKYDSSKWQKSKWGK